MPMRLALMGGEEFSDGFEDVHAGLLEDVRQTLITPRAPHVVYLPTCTADDGEETIERWCATARDKFSALGAAIETPRVVDPASANDARHAQLVAEADLIYLGGGHPHVAMRILPGTRVLDALHAALSRGAFLAGTSGGAMLMGAQSIVMTSELLAEIGRVWNAPGGAPADWDPPLPPSLDCLGIVPSVFCAPHFDRVWFSDKWLRRGLLHSGVTLVGIDERTALVTIHGGWEVRGRGAATLIDVDLRARRYAAGETMAALVRGYAYARH